MAEHHNEVNGGRPAPQRRREGAVGFEPFVPFLDSWGWLKELRFRFEFAVEILSADREFVLPPAPRGGRGDDIRDAYRRDPLLREAVGATLRTGKPRSVTVMETQVRIVPLFGRAPLSRTVIGCLAVADASVQLERAVSARDVDRRLDLACQWLAPAIEATIDAAGSSVTGLHTAQRFASMVEVVHALNDVDDDRKVVQLVMDAVALWFDADVRVYRQRLSGAFTLEAWLPSAEEQDRPLQLPDYGIWADEEVIPGEQLQNVEGFAWDARLAGALLAPIHVDGSPDWLLMVAGSSDQSLASILAFLCRGAGLSFSSRAFAAQDRLRRRVDDMLTAGDPPFAEIVRLSLEAAGRELGATAARVAIYVESRRPSLTIGWGRPEGDEPQFVEPGVVAPSAREIHVGIRIRSGVTAVVEFTRLDGEFSPSDVRLAPVAAGQLGNWLAGVFASRTDTGIELRGAEAAGPSSSLEPDLRGAVRGRAVVVVLIDTSAVDLGSILRELERHLRASEVVIELPRRGAAALLQSIDPAAVTAIGARLRRAMQERFRKPVRLGIAMSDSPTDPPEAVIERAIARAQSGEAPN